ncbi:MAG: hypothetical protein GQ477_02345, partial [Nanohaloarchaea archaeon]|nr:hypothetical protein [Candidatus Nanohaloarchaea archaeon]
MAGYTFTPNNSRPQKKQKQKQNNPDQNTGKKSTRDFSKFESTITQFKTSIFIAAALVLMMFMVGPQITGNLLLDSEDKMLAQNSDFPDLSKFEANKQFYLCQNQMNEDLGKLSEYQLELESRSTTAEACIQQKNTLSQQYNTCADELTSTEANFVYCNSSKTALSQEVEMCNDDLEDKNQEYSDFELSN